MTHTMRITELAYKRKRGQGLVEVAFDDGSVLAVDAELSVVHKLARGMDLSADALEALRRDQHRLEARQRLVRHLALRRKTRRECELYLRRLGFDADAVEGALEKAAALGMIDDQGYAEAYTRTRQRGARKGPRAIRYELLQRGVDRDTAERAVRPAAGRDAQLEGARAAAARKAASLAGDPRARAKLAQFLMRRGYDADVAAEVARAMPGGDDEGEE